MWELLVACCDFCTLTAMREFRSESAPSLIGPYERVIVNNRVGDHLFAGMAMTGNPAADNAIEVGKTLDLGTCKIFDTNRLAPMAVIQCDCCRPYGYHFGDIGREEDVPPGSAEEN